MKLGLLRHPSSLGIFQAGKSCFQLFLHLFTRHFEGHGQLDDKFVAALTEKLNAHIGPICMKATVGLSSGLYDRLMDRFKKLMCTGVPIEPLEVGQWFEEISAEPDSEDFLGTTEIASVIEAVKQLSKSPYVVEVNVELAELKTLMDSHALKPNAVIKSHDIPLDWGVVSDLDYAIVSINKECMHCNPKLLEILMNNNPEGSCSIRLMAVVGKEMKFTPEDVQYTLQHLHRLAMIHGYCKSKNDTRDMVVSRIMNGWLAMFEDHHSIKAWVSGLQFRATCVRIMPDIGIPEVETLLDTLEAVDVHPTSPFIDVHGDNNDVDFVWFHILQSLVLDLPLGAEPSTFEETFKTFGSEVIAANDKLKAAVSKMIQGNCSPSHFRSFIIEMGISTLLDQRIGCQFKGIEDIYEDPSSNRLYKSHAYGEERRLEIILQEARDPTYSGEKLKELWESRSQANKEREKRRSAQKKAKKTPVKKKKKSETTSLGVGMVGYGISKYYNDRKARATRPHYRPKGHLHVCPLKKLWCTKVIRVRKKQTPARPPVHSMPGPDTPVEDLLKGRTREELRRLREALAGYKDDVEDPREKVLLFAEADMQANIPRNKRRKLNSHSRPVLSGNGLQFPKLDEVASLTEELELPGIAL